MTRHEYLDALGRALGFLGSPGTAEALSDMTELYDGLSERGLGDEEIQARIGSPEAVAREYRLMESLDRAEHSPGIAAGLRAGVASIGGNVARGVLLGVLWIALAVTLIGAGTVTVAGAAQAVAVLVRLRPVIATLAVPGIPPITGFLIGLSFVAAGLALIFGARAAMRALAGRMREQVHRTRFGQTPAGDDATNGEDTTGEAVGAGDAVGAGPTRETAGADDPSPARHLLRHRLRPHWLLALAAAAFAGLGALLAPIVPAPEFPLVVDERASLHLDEAQRVEIIAAKVDVVLRVADEPAARLSGNLRKTLAQSISLHVTRSDETIRVRATHVEGLSWGINPWPVLEIDLPAELAIPVSIRADEANVDLSALPQALRERATVTATPRW